MGIDRIFQCKPGQDITLLIPDGDSLPLDQFNNAMEIYRDDEKVLVMVRLDKGCLDAIRYQTDMEPLSIGAVLALNFSGSYAGETLKDVFKWWPELDGERVVGQDEEDNDITVPIVSRSVWA